ncbi:MAG: hypothetical protein K6T80_04745 [Firmicutes bacterium]|nr:hypothetical protein [Bacillota bacterium]
MSRFPWLSWPGSATGQNMFGHGFEDMKQFRRFTADPAGLLPALLVVFVFLLAVAASWREAGAGVLEERREAYGEKSALAEREKEILAGLLDLDVKIENARLAGERLEEEIREKNSRLEEAQATLSVCRARREESLYTLGRWVDFYYRQGPVPYLEVLLQARDFYDFANRLELLKMLIASQARLFAEAKSLLEQMEEAQRAVVETRAGLVEKKDALAGAIREMEELRAGRQVLLEAAGKESELLEERIAAAELEWVRSLNSLRFLLDQLGDRLWSRLVPEKIGVNVAGVSLEFSDGQINRVLAAQEDGFAGALTIESSPGALTIRGKTPDEEEYGISGGFTVSPDGTARFVPDRLDLAGIPVSGGVLAYIASARALSFNPGEMGPGLKLAGINPERGKLVVVLRRN